MAAEKSKMKNLTEGSPAKLIIGFAIPMFLWNVISAVL